MIRILTLMLLTLGVVHPLDADAEVKDAPLKVVLHNNSGDPEVQKHALRNVRNMLHDAPGISVEVVSHGSGISLVLSDGSPAADEVRELIERRVRFTACRNTMEQKNINSSRLLPGVDLVQSGAVEIAKKQSEGYSYFKP